MRVVAIVIVLIFGNFIAASAESGKSHIARKIQDVMENESSIGKLPDEVQGVYLKSDMLPVFRVKSGENVVCPDFTAIEESCHYQSDQYYIIWDFEFLSFATMESFLYSLPNRVQYLHCHENKVQLMWNRCDIRIDPFKVARVIGIDSQGFLDIKVPERILNLFGGLNSVERSCMPFIYNDGLLFRVFDKKKRNPSNGRLGSLSELVREQMHIFSTDGSSWYEWNCLQYPIHDLEGDCVVVGPLSNPSLILEDYGNINEFSELLSYEIFLNKFRDSIARNDRDECLVFLQEISKHYEFDFWRKTDRSLLQNPFIADDTVLSRSLKAIEEDYQYYDGSWYKRHSWFSSTYYASSIMPLAKYDVNTDKTDLGLFRIQPYGKITPIYIYATINGLLYGKTPVKHNEICGLFSSPQHAVSNNSDVWLYQSNVGLACVHCDDNSRIEMVADTVEVADLGNFIGCDRKDRLYFKKYIKLGPDDFRENYQVVKPEHFRRTPLSE